MGSTQTKPIKTCKICRFYNGNIMSQTWFRDTDVHHDDGPAYIEYYENGNPKSQIWYKDGKRHRDGDRPAEIDYYENGKHKSQIWYKDGRCHREQSSWNLFESSGNSDKPAQIYYYENGKILIKKWVKYNRCHRDGDEPAEIVYYGDGNLKSQIWYKDGRCHRGLHPSRDGENGPAHIKINKNKKFDLTTGKEIHSDGDTHIIEYWYKDGKPFNMKGGPIIIHYNNHIKVREVWNNNCFYNDTIDFYPNEKLKMEIFVVE